MYNGKSRHIYLIHNTIKHLLSNEIVSIVKLNKNIAELKGFREVLYNSPRRIYSKHLKIK
jgi:hypothetical protein